MTIFYWDGCAFISGSKWVPATLDAKGNHFVVTNEDGSVLSIQPDGSQGTRPAGTDGPWEQCQPDPAVNTLHFSVNGIPYQVVYRGR